MNTDKLEAVILRNILRNLPVGLMVIDREGLISVTNQALIDILGLPEDVFFDKGWAQIFFDGPGRNMEFNQVIVDVITKRTDTLRRTVPYTAPDGSPKTLCTVSSFLAGDDGVAGIVLLIQDVTEMHEMHEREKEMLSRVNALQEEKVKSLDALAMSVAHQVRNPTTTIGGFASRLLRSSCDKGASSGLEVILDQTQRLELIVRAVGEYASLPGPSPVRVDLGELAHHFARDMAPEAEARAKTIQWDIGIRNLFLEADPDLLCLALRELVLNSLDFCARDSVSVAIRARAAKSACILEVEDDGPGVDPQDLPLIFNPFFTTKAVGVGMGLPKVKRICVDHKGEVALGPAPAGGCLVTITLPQAVDGSGICGPAGNAID